MHVHFPTENPCMNTFFVIEFIHGQGTHVAAGQGHGVARFMDERGPS